MKNQKIENPFIGLRTYEEADARQFRGRASATSDLYGLIEENEVVVLHAESGEGKSSLLNAGLFPLMRDERYFPVKVSFTEDDFALETPDFDKIVCQRIVEAVSAINGDAVDTDIISDSARMDGKVSLVFAGKTSLAFPEIKTNIWWLLRNYSLKAYGAELTPVLVFDQFEEVFTRPGDISWTEDFFLWLRSTLNDETPEKVVDAIRSRIGEYATFPRISTDKKFRALFSLRTEYIGELDYWAIQRHHISVLKNSRYCLKPLTEHEADEVLDLQPAFSEEVKRQIKQAICSSQTGRRHSMQLPMIPAMLLSVVSTTASNNVQKTGKAYEQIAEIQGESLGSDVFTNIIAQFYNREVGDLKIPRKTVREIESVLIDDKGKRVRIKADSKELRIMQFETRYKSLLEQKRLIKCTKINGDEYVEIAHDAIARVIVRQHDANTRDRAKWINIGLSAAYSIAVLLAIVFLSAIFLYKYSSDIFYNQYSLILDLLLRLGESAVIVYSGIVAYRKVKSDRHKLYAAVMAYAGVMLFCCLTDNISFIHNYHNELPDGFWPERIIRQSIRIVIYTLVFGTGVYLCRRQGKLQNTRWQLYIGSVIICITAFLLITYTRLWTGVIIVMVVFDVFCCLSYIMYKDRNAMWISVLSVIILLGAMIILWNSDDVYKVSLTTLILVSIVFVIIGALFEKKRSAMDAFKIVIEGRALKDYKLVLSLFGVFCMAFLALLSFEIGRRLNDIYSLIGMILICPVSVFVLKKYVFNLKSNGIVIKAICALTLGTVICIWGLQYVYYHIWIMAAIWIVSIAAIIRMSYKLSVKKSAGNPALTTIIGSCTRYILVYLISAILIPYILMGYNYSTVHATERVYGKIGSTFVQKYIYVRNSEGKLGLVDRFGKLVVPAEWDDIIPIELITPTYDENGLSVYENRIYWTSGFVLTTGWQLSFWNEDTNKYDVVPKDPTREKLSKEKVFLDRTTLAQVEQKDIIEAIEIKIKESNDSVAQLRRWRFDYKDYRDLIKLRKIDIDSINTDLVLTSDNFKNTYIEKIQSNLKMGKLGLVSTVVSPDFNWDEAIQRCLADKGESNNLQQQYSDRITDEMVLRREIGSKLAKVAYNYLVAGRLEEAERLSRLALDKGGYADFGKTVHAASLILQGKNESARDFMSAESNRLVSYDDIFPEQEDAWYEIKYHPIEWKLESMRLTYDQKEKLKKGLSEIGYEYKIEDMLEFDDVQLIEDSVIGNAYRFTGLSIMPDCHLRNYSYYVRDNKRITPPLSFWAYPLNEMEAPVLAINLMTKKRQYAKFDHLYQDVDYFVDESNMPRKFRSNKYLQSLKDKAQGSYHIKTVRELAPVEIQTVPTMLEGEYDHAWPFSEGLAAVEVNGKIGFIDTEGKIVIEPQFMSPYKPRKDFYGSFYGIYNMGKYAQPYFKNGVCTVYDSNGKIIRINKAGERVF